MIYFDSFSDVVDSLIHQYKLTRSFPFLKNYNSRFSAVSYEIQQTYSDYVTNISSVDMAVSIESAIFLKIFLEHLQPKSILDLGSGFSSYIFRQYAKDSLPREITVVSVDDSAEWIARTEQFLTEKQLDAGNLISWDEFTRQKSLTGFDIIFHDLGSMETRMIALKWILENKVLTKDSLLILDDVHKKEYQHFIETELATYRHQRHDIKNLTSDGLLRYAMLFSNIEK